MFANIYISKKNISETKYKHIFSIIKINIVWKPLRSPLTFNKIVKIYIFYRLGDIESVFSVTQKGCFVKLCELIMTDVYVCIHFIHNVNTKICTIAA